ncbi:universal stress protein [Caenimonas aquaedulcis]|uniref:Universal stress protein n=1 Tax=Caenimonas aquaedulcis TaxID=2793270 RepID=A0A931H7N7_9BURK|nr:universal stress protein [Caenimonas aquaedulcis]MBG9390205.1 universal stress protein [Caenimonas aquaedulcis]
MKVLLAADGSKFTKKALAFVVANESLLGDDGELIVLHVQTPLSPRVKTMVGAQAVADYHRDESEKVLAPIRKFLDRHGLRYRANWVVGPNASEIVRAAGKQKAQMIVMGTQGLGMLGRALLGSVAQRVVTESDIPVLLVK